MTAELLRSVTDEEIATYERDGVVVLRDIYPSSWVDQLRSAMDEVFARSAPDGRTTALAGGVSLKGSRSDMGAKARQLLEDDQAVENLALQGGSIPNGRSIVETDACNWHDGLRAHHSDGPLPQVVAALTRSSKVVLYSDQLFLKEPGSSVMTPWHQDKPYWVMKSTTFNDTKRVPEMSSSITG